MPTQEKRTRTVSGWFVVSIQLVMIPAIVWAIWTERVGVFAPLIVTWALLAPGYFTLQPNMSAVLTLFGAYQGTVRDSGFHWANPFLRKQKISLRSRNLNGEKIKVNDRRGNPIEIAAVVVWRVEDTARAVFDVDDFGEYVKVQSEASLRHLAGAYPYDDFDGDGKSLQGDREEISTVLHRELTEQMSKAGVVIEEAWLSHLAYATEIAHSMLQRQQAEAVVAARTRIVEGAVGMVEMALEELEKKQTIALDEERKAAMVSNLLVVLCGDKNPTPVVNAGTIYS